MLKWLPGGDKIDRYFAKYQSAQIAPQRDHQVARAPARTSCARTTRPSRPRRPTCGRRWASSAEYNELAAALDAAVEQKVAELEAAGRTEDANTLRSDALFPIRQRRQDIMTQMAVSPCRATWRSTWSARTTSS